MDITSNFRRKVKYHKPIIVFKQLYRDYFKSTNIKTKTLSKQVCQLQPIQEVKPRLNNKYADHLSKYLMANNPQYFSQTELRYIKQQYSINKTRLSQTRSNTFEFKNLERSKLQELQKQKQFYFRNTFTENHPLFNINRHLKQKVINSKQNVSQVLPQIFKQAGNTLKTPHQRRFQLSELKQKLSELQKIGRQKFSKIRHNYLLNRCHSSNKNSQPYIQKYRNNISKNDLNKTKQNIFPGSTMSKNE